MALSGIDNPCETSLLEVFKQLRTVKWSNTPDENLKCEGSITGDIWGSEQFTCWAELKIDSCSDLNSCIPLDLSAFMGFMALCCWCQTDQCFLTHVCQWVIFTRNLFMSGFKTEKMVSVSVSVEKQRHLCETILCPTSLIQLHSMSQWF